MAARPGRWRTSSGDRMTLGAHLRELRKRLFRAAIAIVAGSVAGWFLYPWAWEAIQHPIAIIANAAVGEGGTVALNFTNVTGAFDIRIQVAVTIGLVGSSPVWLYQLFAFLVPGLTKREKRYTFGFFFSAVPLFLAGCLAGWFVLPHVVQIMYGFVPAGTVAFYDTKYYIDFVLKLVVATGVAFVLPVFLVLLNFIGILSGKSILGGWRWAALSITLFTAIATPAADVISMILLAIPMVMLYFGAVAVALIHDRLAARRLGELYEENPKTIVSQSSKSST